MSSTGLRLKEWTVLLEAADTVGVSTIEPESFRRLVESWAVSAPTALYSPSRYALQVTLEASDAPSALSLALSLWKDALRRGGLPEWELVRAEILTSEELEQELQAAERSGGPVLMGPPSAGAERLIGDELLRRALHDPRTGLPNRAIFLDEVRQALASPHAGPMGPAVVAVCLDTHECAGHPQAEPATKELSSVLAERLTAAVRCTDRVATIGPGEFAALVTLAEPLHADRLAERLVRTIRSAGAGLGRALTASVGLATATSRNDDADELVMTAELAMLAAQDQGGDRHVRFATASRRFRGDAAT